MMRGTIVATLLGVAAASASARADETRTEGLNLELTPYFWAAGQDAELDLEVIKPLGIFAEIGRIETDLALRLTGPAAALAKT